MDWIPKKRDPMAKLSYQIQHPKKDHKILNASYENHIHCRRAWLHFVSVFHDNNLQHFVWASRRHFCPMRPKIIKIKVSFNNHQEPSVTGWNLWGHRPSNSEKITEK